MSRIWPLAGAAIGLLVWGIALPFLGDPRISYRVTPVDASGPPILIARGSFTMPSDGDPANRVVPSDSTPTADALSQVLQPLVQVMAMPEVAGALGLGELPVAEKVSPASGEPVLRAEGEGASPNREFSNPTQRTLEGALDPSAPKPIVIEQTTPTTELTAVAPRPSPSAESAASAREGTSPQVAPNQSVRGVRERVPMTSAAEVASPAQQLTKRELGSRVEAPAVADPAVATQSVPADPVGSVATASESADLVATVAVGSEHAESAGAGPTSPAQADSTFVERAPSVTPDPIDAHHGKSAPPELRFGHADSLAPGGAPVASLAQIMNPTEHPVKAVLRPAIMAGDSTLCPMLTMVAVLIDAHAGPRLLLTGPLPVAAHETEAQVIMDPGKIYDLAILVGLPRDLPNEYQGTSCTVDFLMHFLEIA